MLLGGMAQAAEHNDSGFAFHGFSATCPHWRPSDGQQPSLHLLVISCFWTTQVWAPGLHCVSVKVHRPRARAYQIQCFDAWVLDFPVSLETLLTPSPVLGCALVNGGHSVWVLEVCSAPHCVSESRVVPGTQSVPSKQLRNETLLTHVERALVWTSEACV